MKLRIHDHARFSDEDPREVVLASFACGACLTAAELVLLTGTCGERKGTSSCPHCAAVTEVAMSDAQAEQMWMLQRGRTFVHFAPEYW